MNSKDLDLKKKKSITQHNALCISYIKEVLILREKRRRMLNSNEYSGYKHDLT